MTLQGQATDIMIQAEEIIKMKKLINGLYVKHTKQPLELIGMFMSCTEAATQTNRYVHVMY